MATMSYCAIENSAEDLAVAVEKIEAYATYQEWYDDLNRYEKRALPELRDLCREFLNATDKIEEVQQ